MDEEETDQIPVLRPLSEEYQTISSLPPIVDLHEPLPFDKKIGRVVTKTSSFEDVEDEEDTPPFEEEEDPSMVETTQFESQSPSSPPIPDQSLPIDPSLSLSLPPDSSMESSTSPSIENSLSPLSPPTVTSRYGRTIKPPKVYDTNVTIHYVLNMSIDEAISLDPIKARESIERELQQMLSKGVWHPVHPCEATTKIIPSKLFIKEKTNNGTKIFKCRLVAGGHIQIRYKNQNFSSPTASIMSLFTFAMIIAKEGLIVCTIDITGAYLNALMTSDVFVQLNSYISAILIKIDPSYRRFLTRNNSIIVKLDKALYGCIQSGKLWFLDISNFLKSIGFTQTTADECVFFKSTAEKSIYILLYVDDFLIATKDTTLLDELISSLQNKYNEITVHTGTVHQYLGMQLDSSNQGKVRISMIEYIRKILQENHITQSKRTPYDNNLFVEEDLPLLPPEKQSTIHTTVAQLLYLSTRSRADISLPVNYLCTRVQKFNSSDEKKLNLILQYLYGTVDLELVIECPDPIPTIYALADASFASGESRKSRSGHIITFGKGFIYAKSQIQRIVTKSSTEAELVAASDIISSICHVQSLLHDLQIPIKGVELLQDNISTIKLLNNCKPTSFRSKHIDIRYFFLRDRSKSNITINHLPTDDMIADLLTKPLPVKQFQKLRKLMMNHP